MSAYVALKFKGKYDELIKFFNSKDWDFEPKKIDNETVYMKIDKDLKEEISFFKTMELGEENTVLEDINDITDEDFENAKVMDETPKEDPTKSTPVNDLLLDSDRGERFRENPNNAYPDEPKPKVDLSQFTDLTARAGLKDDDPMKYLTSANFMTKFFVVCSVILLVMNILS